MASLFPWSVSAQEAINRSVFFESGKYDLNASSQHTLRDLAAHLLKATDYTIQLDAYTDNTGGTELNQQLAQNRAIAVRDFLNAQGVQAHTVNIQNWGAAKQSYSNQTTEGRSKNRRVDLTAIVYQINDLTTLLNRLQAQQSNVRAFTLAPNKEQTITTAAGTKVVVPAKAFVFFDGTPVTDSVLFTVTEALRPSDWLVNGLTTQSNGTLLQSAGMVRLEAIARGQRLALAPNMELTVAIPNKKPFDAEMQLFYGQHDSLGTAAGNMDWQLADDSNTFRPTLEGSDCPRIDPTIGKRLATMRFDTSPMPKMPVFTPYSPRPEAKVKGRPPVKPTRPSLEAIVKKYEKNGEISNRNRRIAKREFRKKTKQYGQDSIIYVYNLEKYERRLEANRLLAERSDPAILQWQRDVQNRWFTARRYQEKYYYYYYSRAFNALVPTLADGSPIQYCRSLNSKMRMLVDSTARAMMGNTAFSLEPNKAGEVYERAFGVGYLEKDPKLCRYLNVYEGARISQFLPDYKDSSTIQINLASKRCGLRPLSDSLYQVQQETKLARRQDRLMVADYITEVTQLGWINVDRFYKNQEPPITLAYLEKEAFAMYAYFPELQSMLMLDKSDDLYFRVKGVPKGQKMILLTIKSQDGQLMLRKQNTTSGVPLKEKKVAYEPFNLKGFMKQIEQLNG